MSPSLTLKKLLVIPNWFFCFVLLAGNLPTRVLAAEPKLNFIFILIDDLGWADLGCYGSSFYETRNLDRLASQGMKFTDAYAAAPVCSPTRASILTGKYSARLNLTDWLPGRRDMPSQKLLRPEFQQQLPLAEATLAEVLKRAGYVNASLGKWHLGGKGFLPEDQGFNVNIAGDHSGTPASYFFPYINQRNPDWKIPGLESGREGEYLTDRLTTEAVQFMEKNRDRPFLLYLPHYAVHTPLSAKKDLIRKYEQKARPAEPQNNPVYGSSMGP